MDLSYKNNLSGLVGHTISEFMIYSFEKLEDSKSIETDNKSHVFDNCDHESGNSTENSSYVSNSPEGVSNSTFREPESNYNGSATVPDVVMSYPSKSSKNEPDWNLSDTDSFETEYYNDYARLHNMNVKNDVGYSRFISKIRLNEARSVIYGTWDPELSESMWNQINGEEADVDIIFNDAQIVREENLLKAKKRPEVTLSTDHLVDYISYVKVAYEISSNKFLYNKKYVLLFGGAQLSDNDYNTSYTNLFSLLNGNVRFEFSNNLYFSEAQSFRSNWELLDTLNAPQPRAFHASCVIYASLETPVLVVCGGFTYDKQVLSNELYILNLNVHPLVWDIFKTSGPTPPSRYGHSISYVGSHLVLFGGTNGFELFNDVWSLNINYGIYTQPGKQSSNQWSKVCFGSLVPAPRAFHSCCKAGISSNSPMVIYGGLTESEPIRNRLYALHCINEKLIWSIIPTYTKCPSELRMFHSMIFLDNMFIVTGGDCCSYENYSNIKSIVYSFDTKQFQYVEDSIELSGHASWSAFGIVYHWGGVKYLSGKLTFDDSISVSNPLAYSDDRNIEEIYFKYIRYASINNMYDESKDEPNVNSGHYDVKMGVDVHSVVSRPLDAIESGATDTLSPSFERSDNSGTSELTSPVKQENRLNGTPLSATDSVNRSDNISLQQTQPGSIPPYQARPRRSAALKCLTAIELDNIKHKEQERLKENPDN